MEITKENIDELNAAVKIKLEPGDYQSKVNKILQDHQKKARLDGFRPGKIPIGMIKKMYGKAVLVDEINNILTDSLYKYISENKIDILGSPLPKTDEISDFDWDNQKEFEFTYEIGLSPKFDVKFQNEKVNRYSIKVDDKLTNDYIDYIKKSNGTPISLDISDENGLIYGEFKELDENGSILEEGLSISASLSINSIKDNDEKKKIIGLKKDDKVIININKAIQNKDELAALFNIDKKAAEKLKPNFQFTVKTISGWEKAEINQELFDKIYGKGKINSEKDFMSKIEQEISAIMKIESEKKLINDIIDNLIEKTNIPLPDEFLKKWMVKSSKEPVTIEQINNEYDSYSNNLKWQLIESKIIKDNEIKVSKEEALNEAKNFLKNQYVKYGQPQVDEQELNDIAENILKSEKDSRNIYDNLYYNKVISLLKNSYKITEKEVSNEDFANLASKTTKQGSEKNKENTFTKFFKQGLLGKK